MLILPEIKKKSRGQSYIKPDSVKLLEAMATTNARQKYPTIPAHALAPRKFRDDTANNLTTCIVTYISLNGGFASRINNQGTYNTKLNRFIPGTSRKGLADIIAAYRGLSLHIEVKIGRDKLSKYQKSVRIDVERSGGLFYVAHNFSEFKEWFDKIDN